MIATNVCTLRAHLIFSYPRAPYLALTAFFNSL